MPTSIHLRPLQVSDAAEMARTLQDPSLYEFTGGEPPTEESLTGQYTVQTRGNSAEGGERWLNRLVVLDSTGEAIGYVQATIPLADDPTEISWVIGAPWQRQGHASAAASLLLAELARFGVTDVVAHIHPDHEASAAAARRIGMTPTDQVVAGETRWVGTLAAHLRPLRIEDSDAILEAFLSDPTEMARQGDVTDAASARTYVERFLGTPTMDATVVADAATDRLLGLVTVLRDETNRNGWFAYWMHPEARGRGLAGRAAATVAHAELTEGRLERLELGHRANNPASGAVARAAGFLHEGTQRGHFLIDGVRHDVHIYGRLTTDPTPETGTLPWRGGARPWRR